MLSVSEHMDGWKRRLRGLWDEVAGRLGTEYVFDGAELGGIPGPIHGASSWIPEKRQPPHERVGDGLIPDTYRVTIRG